MHKAVWFITHLACKHLVCNACSMLIQHVLPERMQSRLQTMTLYIQRNAADSIAVVAGPYIDGSSSSNNDVSKVTQHTQGSPYMERGGGGVEFTCRTRRPLSSSTILGTELSW